MGYSRDVKLIQHQGLERCQWAGLQARSGSAWSSRSSPFMTCNTHSPSTHCARGADMGHVLPVVHRLDPMQQAAQGVGPGCCMTLMP